MNFINCFWGKTKVLSRPAWPLELSLRSHSFKTFLVASLCAVSALVTHSAWAQASSLLWRTNVGGHVFAVDALTNVYAYAGTNVIVLNADGQAQQTNSFCPLPGIAQRDSAGNYYFAGNIDGTQDFGGITVVGGWTNCYRKDLNRVEYQPGYPTCFVAKYASNGSLQWVTGFGKQGGSTQGFANGLTDLLLDPSGGVYAGYVLPGTAGNGMAHIGATGELDWDKTEMSFSYLPYLTAKLGAATATNCCYISPNASSINAFQLDRSGQATALGMMLSWENNWVTNSKPVIDASGHLYLIAGIGFPSSHILTSVGPQTNCWSRQVPAELMWTLATDPRGNLYLGGTNGALAQYGSGGDPLWSTLFDQPVLEMLVDGAGNRFVSFADGSIGRLESDNVPQPVIITKSPVSQTVFAGDSVTLSVDALGTAPLYYSWRLDGTDLPEGTNSQLQLNPVLPSQGGTYTVLVTNARNGVVSAPAVVRVRSVAFYADNQILTNGSYDIGSAPTLTVRSAFPGGQIYFTLDGSAPNRSSTPYSGPFQLRRDTTLKAVAYSADGQQSAESDVVQITMSSHNLSISVSGGGMVTHSPMPPYFKGATVTLSAVPDANWSFLYWLEDASGSEPVTTVSMDEERSVTAVFGTNEPSGILPPDFAWRTNFGAHVFAVDTATNVYAYAGTNVLVLNAEGQPQQTNSFCPLPGMAQRDSVGNYYIAGSFDGSQDFGGITLVGGWTNGWYRPGYPTCFLAKYGSNGSLQWVTGFGAQGGVDGGSQGYGHRVTDLVLDPSGGVYVGYVLLGSMGRGMAHVGTTGELDWVNNELATPYLTVRLGAATATDCGCISPYYGSMGALQLDRAGQRTPLGMLMFWENGWSTNSEPVTDSLGHLYLLAMGSVPPSHVLMTVGAQTNYWIRKVPQELMWTLATDLQGNLYLGGTNGALAQYTSGGDPLWYTLFDQPVLEMLVDGAGNRFVTLADGSIGRLQADGAPSSRARMSVGTAKDGVSFSLVSQPQQAWEIQLSTNLVDWRTLGVVTNNTGRLIFGDAPLNSSSGRFYRALPVAQ